MSFESPDYLDPMFLLSRQLDGDLTNEESLALEAALAASPELRAEAKRLAAAQGAVDQWAAQVPNFDDNHLALSVLAAVREDAEERELGGVDAMLQRWARPVEFNERTFTTGVMRQLAAETSRQRMRLVYRIAAPLAMAAAVAIAVTGSFWLAPTPVIQVSIGPLAASSLGATSLPAATSVVTFGREAAPERVASAEVRMISLGAMGAEPMVNADEVPPL